MGIRNNLICNSCGKYEVPYESGSSVCKKCDDGQVSEMRETPVRKNKSDVHDPEFICSECGQKGVVHRKNKGKCKKCEAVYLREWKKRTGKQKQYNRRIAIKRRRVKELCVQYLGAKCQYEGGCSSPSREGLEPCWMMFHFHHKDPTLKIFDISRRMRNRGTISNINSLSDLRQADPELVEELDKCILLCANCHHRLEYCDGCKRVTTTE